MTAPDTSHAAEDSCRRAHVSFWITKLHGQVVLLDERAPALAFWQALQQDLLKRQDSDMIAAKQLIIAESLLTNLAVFFVLWL